MLSSLKKRTNHIFFNAFDRLGASGISIKEYNLPFAIMF